jgi:glycosyltransferase involved in cell wall biosynthesis
MPQILDLVITVVAKYFFKAKITYLIHEIGRRGELRWPTKNAIKRRLRISDSVVVFNSVMYKEISKFTSAELVKLPLEHRNYFNPFNSKIPTVKPYFLWIGRNDFYKGLGVLVESWSLLDADFPFDLIVAGSGLDGFESKNGIFFMDQWLSDKEVWAVIKNAHCVVLPYTSSTQSGILSMAHFCQIPAVLTPVPELLEQAHARDIVLENFSQDSLIHGLKAAAKKTPKPKLHLEKQPTQLTLFISLRSD